MLHDVGFSMDLEMNRIREWKGTDRQWRLYVSGDLPIPDQDPEGVQAYAI